MSDFETRLNKLAKLSCEQADAATAAQELIGNLSMIAHRAGKVGAKVDGYIARDYPDCTIALTIDLSPLIGQPAPVDPAPEAPADPLARILSVLEGLDARLARIEAAAEEARPQVSAETVQITVPAGLFPPPPEDDPDPVPVADPVPVDPDPVPVAPAGRWTEAEDARLLQLVAADAPKPEIEAAFPGRSWRAIYQRAARLKKQNAKGVPPASPKASPPPAPSPIGIPPGQAAASNLSAEQAPTDPVGAGPDRRADSPAGGPQVPDRPADRAMAPAGTKLPPTPDPVANAAARLAHRLDRLGYAAPWSPELDYALIQDLTLGRKLAEIALDLGIDAAACKARFAALVPHPSVEEQAAVLQVLRARAPQAA